MKILAFALLAICCLSLFAPAPGRAAQNADVAVIYPDVPAPYSIVFDDMIAGIAEGYGGQVRPMVLDRDADVSEVESWLAVEKIDNVIALGNQALDIVIKLPANYVTVTGAVLSVDPVEGLGPDFSAITLAPDPDHTFAKLKELAPDIEVISVIYNEGYHGRLVARAKEVAAKHELTIEVHDAAGLSEDSILYRKFFKVEDRQKRAVWLLQGDRALEDRSVLYNLLKDAWYNKILVFSDNPSYVKKGVLFALYPDNSGVGGSLVEALDSKQKGQNIGVVQTTDLHSALNIRTAEHLGLSITRSQRREFNVIFPRR